MMKKFFIYLSAIAAVMTSGISCSKDDPEDEKDPVEMEKEAVAEAVDAATIPLYDANGKEIGKAITLKAENRILVVAHEMCDQLFVKDPFGEFVEMKTMTRPGMEGVNICSLPDNPASDIEPIEVYKDTEVRSAVNTRAEDGEAGSNYLIDIAQACAAKQRVMAANVYRQEVVEARLDEFAGMTFLDIYARLAGQAPKVQVYAYGVDQVNEIESDGPCDVKYILVQKAFAEIEQSLLQGGLGL